MWFGIDRSVYRIALHSENRKPQIVETEQVRSCFQSWPRAVHVPARLAGEEAAAAHRALRRRRVHALLDLVLRPASPQCPIRKWAAKSPRAHLCSCCCEILRQKLAKRCQILASFNSIKQCQNGRLLTATRTNIMLSYKSLGSISLGLISVCPMGLR